MERGKNADLSLRFLSALVLGPLALAAIFLGGFVFEVVVLACALISAKEWAGMSSGGSRRSVGLLFATIAIAYWLVLSQGVAWAVGGVLAMAVLAAIGGRIAGLPNPYDLALGVPYIGLPLISIIALRADPQDGLGLVAFLVLVIWANDIGAYAAGRSLKGPKLAPRISPNKTWSGAIGGLVFGAAMGAATAAFFSLGHPALMFAIGVLLGISGQAGDLFESFIKRRFKVKDSGVLIPGHGGMLDRVDSLLTGALFLGFVHYGRGEWLG